MRMIGHARWVCQLIALVTLVGLAGCGKAAAIKKLDGQEINVKAHITSISGGVVYGPVSFVIDEGPLEGTEFRTGVFPQGIEVGSTLRVTGTVRVQRSGFKVRPSLYNPTLRPE